MDKNLIWDVVSEGTRSDLVLAVDYSVNGRHEAGFADLAAKLSPTRTIWETLAPPVGEEAGMTGDAYVARWVDAIKASGREVGAVLGYCASSAFASAIGEGVAAFQATPPKIVLFDPTPATAFTILHFGFFKVIDSLSSALSEEDVTKVQKEGWEAAARNNDDLATFRDEIVEIYRRIGDKAFARIGLNAHLGEQLVAWFRGYVTYLIAAGEFAGGFDLSQTSIICSSALEEPPGEVLQELRFDVDHADLLRNEDVAAALSKLLLS